MENLVRGIVVKGAREHNLKNINLTIPQNKITVITGLSGSGKSSLAFDTIYAEGQRRYVESLSAYARNFLEQMKKPEVDGITGLSPAIAIDQRSVSTNPRSTVGTITEIYDYLRLLYAKLGKPYCPQHHLPVTSQTPQLILEDVLALPAKSKFYILAPMAQSKKGEFYAEFQKWASRGFLKAKVDGFMISLEGAKKLLKTKAHDIDLVIDQVILTQELRGRIAESLNTALKWGEGRVVIEDAQTGDRKTFSIHSACPQCGFSFPELEPRMFSFNNPRGACPTCHGLGTTDLEEAEVYEQKEEVKRLKQYSWHMKGTAKSLTDDVEDSEEVDERALKPCPECLGSRLRLESRHVFINEKRITELADMSAEDLLIFLEKAQWTTKDLGIAEKILKQINRKLRFLQRVGVGYLSLSRPARTLAGGEAQRLRLASQVGSALVGILYVLDEPSIGLHPRDHHRMLEILRELSDRGNTVLIVEHDEETIRSADYIIDIGPRAGKLGGELVGVGTPEEISQNENSVTGQYLSGIKKIPVPLQRRRGHGQSLHLKGASGNNLKHVELSIPLGKLVGISGVSGSGKSTLVIDTLYRILARHFNNSSLIPAPYESIEGLNHIDRVIEINQHPIGRTPRSTPATYVGLFPIIRTLFSQIPESRMRGYNPGRFSFNVKGGRCEGCQGQGQSKVEMHFLSDVYVQCDTCMGRRYNHETLSVKYRGKNIAEVLNMSVTEALDFFKHHSAIYRKVETLSRVGLDYISLGQSSTTLSGGEAQRVKLSRELSKKATGKTLYILDEPTTGLHFADVAKLVELLHELVNQGNTVIVIEHNMDVIKSCDWLIDLGPDGGNKGGEIVVSGTPEMVAQNPRSETGKYLVKSMIHDNNSSRRLF